MVNNDSTGNDYDGNGYDGNGYDGNNYFVDMTMLTVDCAACGNGTHVGGAGQTRPLLLRGDRPGGSTRILKDTYVGTDTKTNETNR